MASPTKYLYNLAATICGQIGGIDTDKIDASLESDEFPAAFWLTYGLEILNALKKFGPEAKGKIVYYGLGSSSHEDITHGDMNNGKYLNTPCDANQILNLLAGYVVAAKICLTVRDSQLAQKAKSRLQDPFLDQVAH